MQKNILVTGGAGYIGSHTSSLLERKGYKVFILDNLDRGNESVCKGFTLFQVDLRDKAKVAQALRKCRFEAVIHFAGLISVNESMDKPDLYFENNVVGTINLLKAMSQSGIKYLVFSSSAAIYGDPLELPIKEDAPKNPLSAYGQTKWAVEQMLPWYEYKFGIKHVSLRYFNACGADLEGRKGEAHRPESHIIPLIMRAVFGKKEEFIVYGNDYETPDGSCVRDYIHVVDLASSHLMSLEYLVKGGKSDCFNVATGKGYSNFEIVNAVKKITGVDFKVKIGDRRLGDPARLIASNKKIVNTLGWKPKYSDLETIIKTAYQWHKNHPYSLED